MKKLLLIALFASFDASAEGYYYPVPANPPPIQYVLPPAYIVPAQPYSYQVPPPVVAPQIQRGYIEPPPPNWADSKLVPLPERKSIYP